MMLTPEIIAATRRVLDVWDDDNSTLDDFKEATSELARVTGRNLAAMGNYEVKNLADGIIDTHVRQTAGNSGSH